MSSFKSNENIHKKEDMSYYVVSANKASSSLGHICWIISEIRFKSLNRYSVRQYKSGGNDVIQPKYEVNSLMKAIDVSPLVQVLAISAG